MFVIIAIILFFIACGIVACDDSAWALQSPKES